MDLSRLQELQKRLGLQFRDISLLQLALTHRSASVEPENLSNERLEFLGDSIIGLVVCEYLYREFPGHHEGDLAKSKAFIVSENSLAAAALKLGLEEFVVMSTGEASSGGRRRRSILSDALEAVVGAIYLDHGIPSARRVVRKMLKDVVFHAAADQHRGDYKSSLQERTQALYRLPPVYRVVGETGQEHDKTFSVEALLQDSVIGCGEGKTKKEAEQSAAQDALRNLPDSAAPNSPANDSVAVSIM